MSALEGKVGGWKLLWKKAPRARTGEAVVDAVGPDGKTQSVLVKWCMDDHGISIETPELATGFNVHKEYDDDGRALLSLTERGGEGAWAGLSYLRAGEEAAGAGSKAGTKAARVRAQMPGKIVRVHLEVGATVERGQPVMVMEAMKMENEIKAPQAGKIGKIAVAIGQAVESGADLFVVEPQASV